MSPNFSDFLRRNVVGNMLDTIRDYTHLETVGAENVPRSGPVIVVPNHSGVWGWDGLVLQNELLKKLHRVPRTMLHNFWFRNQHLRLLAEQLAFIPQDFKKALQLLRRNNLLLLFPEAEAGNFKPTTQMYEIQDFNPGFISLAILSNATIVPCCIIGAEEAHINLGTIKWTEKWLGVKVPLPLNFIPLPIKWKIAFLKPILLNKYGRKEAKSEKFLIEVAENIRIRIQQHINKELIQRKVFHFLWDS